MTIDATVAEPTHHISFEDGSSNKVGVILCDETGVANFRSITKAPIKRLPFKLQQGNSEYSDLEEPYAHDVQKDWSGGIGLEDGNDKTRYWWSEDLNTMHPDKVFPGPISTYSTGVRDHIDTMYSFGSTNVLGDAVGALWGNSRWIATQFTPTTEIVVSDVEFWASKLGAVGAVTVEIWTDDGGDEPDAVIAGATATITLDQTDYRVDREKVTLGTPPTLAAATKYWLVFIGPSGEGATINSRIVVGATGSGGKGVRSVDGSTWSNYSVYFLARLCVVADPFEGHFFEYKNALYMVTNPDDSDAPVLYYNGERGRSIGTSSSTTLEHTGKTWTTDEWDGCIVKIIAGSGVGEWREITGNDANTLTVSPAWGVTPTNNSSEYVILGSNKWTAIAAATTGLTGPITDVLVSKDIVYFCQGASVNVRKFNYAANTNSYDDEGATPADNRADFYELVQDSAGAQIHKTGVGATATALRADPVSWGSDLTFGNEEEVGYSYAQITGLERYFDPEYLIIFTEKAVYRRVGDEIQQMPIREMESLQDDLNGKASAVGGVYLYFSLRSGLQRYYSNQLDSIGPDVDDGVPEEYHGNVVDVISYPGRIYIAYASADKNTTNRSSIMVRNQFGWHPIYRSYSGTRIRKLFVQVIPGPTLDRLWVSDGPDVFWLPLPSDNLDPTNDSAYKNQPYGWLESSWNYMRLRDLEKTLKEVKVWTEGRASGGSIYVYYRTDETTTWTYVGAVEASPSGSVSVSTVASQIQFQRIKIALSFRTQQLSIRSILKAIDTGVIVHVPTKFRYGMRFRFSDENIDLRGDEESTAVETYIAQLESWANDGTLLTMRHHDEDGPLDDKTVFLKSPTLRPLSNIDDEDLTGYIMDIEVFDA